MMTFEFFSLEPVVKVHTQIAVYGICRRLMNAKVLNDSTLILKTLDHFKINFESFQDQF